MIKSLHFDLTSIIPCVFSLTLNFLPCSLLISSSNFKIFLNSEYNHKNLCVESYVKKYNCLEGDIVLIILLEFEKERIVRMAKEICDKEIVVIQQYIYLKHLNEYSIQQR